MVDTATDPVALLSDVTDSIIDAILHRNHVAEGDGAMEIDDDGWFHGEQMIRTAETSRRQSLAPGLEHVEGICFHWTDTRGCGAARLAGRLLQPNARAASWHMVIDANGDAAQSVSAKHGAWHVGSDSAALFKRDASTAQWSILAPAERGKVRGWGGNSWLFGIELENVGEVRYVNGQWLGWPFKTGTQYGAPAVVPEAEVFKMGATGLHRFTDPQILTAKRVTRALVHRYGLRRDACAWGHNQIDPVRRTDPGPLWLGAGADKGGKVAPEIRQIIGAGILSEIILDPIFAGA